MTLQQLHQIITIAESKSMNEAARKLFVSQPNLSSVVRELEEEAGITIFIRSNRGIVMTPEGEEFIGYAKQVVEQYHLLEKRYMNSETKKKFSVSMQHYSFAVKAFVEMVKSVGMEEYEFAIHETQTNQVIENVRSMKSELGVLFLSEFNEAVLLKLFREYDLEFEELFACDTYVYLWKGHPLAAQSQICMAELEEYPCLVFEQGKSFYAFWEFLLSSELQKEWEELTNLLYDTLAKRNIASKDKFLKDLKKHLFDAGNKVSKTNNKMTEKLSQIIRNNANAEVLATKQVINDIKKLLLNTTQNKDRSSASLSYEALELSLPLERQLNLTPKQEIEYKNVPTEADLGINELERLEKLYNPHQVDRQILRKRINNMLKNSVQTTLAEVIDQNNGIEKGLSELFGYIAILKEYKTVVSANRTQEIAFSKDKTITIPEIIIAL